MLMLTPAALQRVVCVCRYIPHLKGIIKLRQDTDWVDAAHDYPELLSYHGKQLLGYNFEGTTDVLVAKRSAIRAHLPVKGARVLFDLRKHVTDSDLVHAQVRTVLANLHAQAEKPVVVSFPHHLIALKVPCSEQPQRLKYERVPPSLGACLGLSEVHFLTVLLSLQLVQVKQTCMGTNKIRSLANHLHVIYAGGDRPAQ